MQASQGLHGLCHALGLYNVIFFLLDDVRELIRARALLWTLTRREVSARYAGTAAGALWSFAQPLLTIAAYYLVFDVVFGARLSEKAPVRAVGAYLIVGALPWMAFCDTLGRGMTSLLDAGGLLQKNALPLVLFPVRSVLASTLTYGPLLLLLTLAYWPYHHGSLAVLAMLPLLGMQLLLSFVLAYLFAVFAAALRDTTQIVGFTLSLGIFLSPVLFPVSQFPENWQWVLWINPMTAFVLGYQSILLQGHWPDLAVWCAALVWVGVVSLLLGLSLQRCRDQLVDWL